MNTRFRRDRPICIGRAWVICDLGQRKTITVRAEEPQALFAGPVILCYVFGADALKPITPKAQAVFGHGKRRFRDFARATMAFAIFAKGKQVMIVSAEPVSSP